MADPSRPAFIRFRATLARLGFFARLAWRIGGRSFALLPRRKRPAAKPAAATDANPALIEDDDQIIEALQTGNTGLLAQLGPEFAHSLDAQSGQPWLFNAVDLGNLASLHWFLAQGSTLDQPDKDGRSLLQAAVERAAVVDEFDDAPENPLPLIVALLDAGAAINAASRQGLTPLHVAAALGLIEVVQLLLARGADSASRDEGFARSTPRDYAVQAGHSAVADLLR